MKARLSRALATLERLGRGRAGLLRLFALVVVLLGSVVFQGLQVDDYWHRGFFRGDALWAHGEQPFWKMFSFFEGDPAAVVRFRDLGLVPWWSDESVRISFFRPLSALTHYLDYSLWPASPALMHVHSLLWYLALVFVAALVFRRALHPTAAALAALLYAIDHNHGGVVGWVANRNALVAALFGLLALYFHDRASRGHGASRGLAALALTLGLLSGESALGAVGYLGAHALVLDERPLRERARGLLPYVAVVLAWAVVYRLGGYGASGSGLYLDPAEAPLRVLAQVPEYATLLFAAEWGSIGPETELILPPEGRLVLRLVALCVVLGALVALAPRLRTQRSSRFLLLGALFAVIPGCATVPATRLLLLPGFGLIGLVAEAVVDFVTGAGEAARGPVRLVRGWFALWVGGGHLVLSPLLLVPMAWQMVIVQSTLEGFAASFPPDDATLPSQRLVVVGSPDATFGGYVSVLRHEAGHTTPRGMVSLTVGTRPCEVLRESESAIVVTAPGGFLQGPTDFLERDPERLIPVGTRIQLSDVTIDVLRVTESKIPDVARFTFEGGAADARHRWVRWLGGKYVPFELPAIGASVRVEGQAPGS
jgi:hypothetical protein